MPELPPEPSIPSPDFRAVDAPVAAPAPVLEDGSVPPSPRQSIAILSLLARLDQAEASIARLQRVDAPGAVGEGDAPPSGQLLPLAARVEPPGLTNDVHTAARIVHNFVILRSPEPPYTVHGGATPPTTRRAFEEFVLREAASHARQPGAE